VGGLFIEKNEFRGNKFNAFPAWAKDTTESQFRDMKLADIMDCSPEVIEFTNVISLIKSRYKLVFQS
jgi:hypothetical protein